MRKAGFLWYLKVITTEGIYSKIYQDVDLAFKNCF